MLRHLALAFVLSSAPAFAQTQTPVFPGQTDAALRASLIGTYKTTIVRGEDGSKDALYSVIDTVHVGADIGSFGVYSGLIVLLDGQPSIDPSQDVYNNGSGLNQEHVWPRSEGAVCGGSPGCDANAEWDLHNHRASRVSVNGDRGSLPFGEVPDPSANNWYRQEVNQSAMPTSSIDEWSERQTNTRFEPRESEKGDIARAMFYFYTMYGPGATNQASSSFFDAQKDVLFDWHEADPVDVREYARMFRVAALQDDKANPFVLDSTLVRRAFFPGSGGGPSPGTGGVVWINELHYDNVGTDSGEFVEVAGAAGTDLGGYAIVLYNGNGAAPYHTIFLTGTIDDESNGIGALTFAVPNDPGIQNGAPDGLALVDAEGAVVQFLSYEGVFTASGGPANGLLSVDIGVSETNSTPIGQSLSLTGTGRAYADFGWTGAVSDSPGSLNAGQSIPAGPLRVSVKVILEGAYGSGLPGGVPMRSDIESSLPLAQPFASAPWSYSGAEAIPASDGDSNGAPDLLDSEVVVDWVLIGLRSTPSGPDVALGAALLLADGTLLDPISGTAGAAISGAPAGSYHIVVRHRNHLSVLSAAAIPVDASVPTNPVDLSADAAALWGSDAATVLAPGLVALRAGDGDADGAVLAPDRQSVWLPQVGQTGYLSGDYSLDGEVLADDRQAYWAPNVGAQSAVPGDS